MRKERRRPMYYHAQALYDGTVLVAYPIRKPIPKVIKRDHLRIDQEGVCGDDLRAGQELSDWNNETRFRFQDIIATRLNICRAIREIVLLELAEIHNEIVAMRFQLDCLSWLL